MNRNVKVALCTLALMMGGCSIMSANQALAMQEAQRQIAAPEQGIVTKEYVKSIQDAGLSIQSVIDQYADQIVEISNKAFEFCQEELDFSKLINLERVSNDAFFKANLTAINLRNVKSIGTFAFGGCKNLTNVELGPLSHIYDGTFIGCSGIEHITLPESLTSIGKSAFAGTGLKSVRLHKNVKYVDKNAFGGCKNMLYAVIENQEIDIQEDIFGKSFLPKSIRYTGPTSQDNYYFVLGANDDFEPYRDLLALPILGLEQTPVIVFCDNEEIGIPLSEMEGFKLLTTVGNDGQIVTVDLNGNQEPVRSFTKNDHGELLANPDGTLVLAPKGVTHIHSVGSLSDNVKTVVIPDGVVRVFDSLPRSYGTDVDYVIPNSLKFNRSVEYSGINTIYTSNKTVIDTTKRNFDDDLIKPLTSMHHLMLTDDVELQELWREN